MNLTKYQKRAIEFLKEVRLELKRVTWPTKEDTIKYTSIVIGLVLTIAVFLGGLDFLFTWILDKYII